MDYRAILDPQHKQPFALFARSCLRIAAIPYAAAVRWRNRQFDSGRRPIFRASVPVISVGNITTGGTGKTPLVAAIARYLRERHLRVALLSRGYRSDETGSNDEARELYAVLPDVPHLQNPDRVAAAQTAIEELEMQVLVLDDGFQHRRLGRDLDIVLIDATCPFGYGALLPGGLLREPLTGLRRADFVLLSRADRVDETTLATIAATIKRHNPEIAIGRCDHRPSCWLAYPDQQAPLAQLHGHPALAIAGIGNPQPFFSSLDDLGLQVVGTRALADHCAYDQATVEQLVQWINQHQQQHPELVVVCTHKDLVKLRSRKLGNCPLWALKIELQLDADGAGLWELVEGVVSRIDATSAE